MIMIYVELWIKASGTKPAHEKFFLVEILAQPIFCQPKILQPSAARFRGKDQEEETGPKWQGAIVAMVKLDWIKPLLVKWSSVHFSKFAGIYIATVCLLRTGSLIR